CARGIDNYAMDYW
nr:immunoglobulin heavy chain junction region [Mus musculus]